MQRKRIQYVSSAGVLHRTPLHRIQGPYGRISKITLARGASTSTAAATPFLRKCARLRVDSLVLHQERDSPPPMSMASQDGQANVIDLCGSDSDHGAKSRPTPKRTQDMIDLTSDSERNKAGAKLQMRNNGAPNGDRNGEKVPSTGGSVRPGPSRREGDRNSSLVSKKIGEQVTNRSSRPKAEPSTIGRASASDRYGTAVRSPGHRHISRDITGLKRPRENDQSSSALGHPAKKLRLPNGGVTPFSRRLGSGSGRPENSNVQISGMIDLTTEDDGPAVSIKTASSANSASTNIQRNVKKPLSSRQPASSDARRVLSGTGSSSGLKSRLPVIFEKPAPVQSSAGSESSRNRDLPSSSRTRTSKALEQPLQVSKVPTRKSPTVRAHEQSSQGPGLEVPESPPGTEVLPKPLDSNHTSQKDSLPDEDRIGGESRQKSTTPAPPLSKSPKKASPSRQVLPKALDSTQTFQRDSLSDSGRMRAESRQKSGPPTPRRDNYPKQASPSREMHGKDVASSVSKRGYPISPSETSLEDSAQPHNRDAEKEELPLAQPNGSHHRQISSTPGQQPSSGAITHLPQTSSKTSLAVEPSDAITTSPVRAQSEQDTARDGLRVNNDSIREDRQQEEDSESEDETRPTRSVDYVSKHFGPQSSAKLVPVIQSHAGLLRAQNSVQPAESSSAITAEGSDLGELTQHAQTAPAPTKTTAKRPRALKSSDMSDFHHVRLVVRKYLDEMRNDNEHFVRTWLREARHAPPEPGLVQGNGEPTSIFRNMRPLNLQQKTAAQMSKKKKPPTGFAKVSIEKLTIGGAKPVLRTHWMAPYRNFELSGEDVPNYSHYVSIKDNFLAHNEVILQHWPYFGDEFDIGKSQGVRDQYWLDIALRREKLNKMSRAERYAEYCEEMLQDIGLEWSDILHFLLDSSPDVENDPRAQKAVTQRISLPQEDLVTSHEPWTTVVKDLPEPEPACTRRECDADLCGDCGVCDVLDPVHRHNDEILHNNCANANIQRGVPKHTVLGDSGVHGLGLYACEEIRENDFVAEYKGELVTKNEAERRGAVYEHQKLSYLFSLNNEQEIDSTYFGNKVRFINHAVSKKANLFARTIMCNSVHRIALYGSRLIKPGEELFFDYGPMFPSTQLGGADIKSTTQPQTKSAPHVRNSLLVSEFHDLEEVEEHGLRRARKSEKFNKSTTRSQARVQTASSKRAGKSTRRPRGGKKAQVNEDVEMQEAGANDDEDEPPRAKSAKNAQTDEYVEMQEAGDHDDQDEDYEATGIANDASEYRPQDDGNASEDDEQEREEVRGGYYIDAAGRVRPARTRSRTRTRRNEL
ncbi:ESC E(Z) complex [Lecanosticta acicola]|uniref:ESC E(Z) complex, partial n=1 Tax=Lecanosticta acicola TaxID=111012 RepID=A0AAI8Z514_9PEZI|nr:ESC E(Z) complex [Lecanosticta acicola]